MDHKTSNEEYSMRPNKHILFVALVVILARAEATYKLQERYSWTAMDFAYPDAATREDAIASRSFVPENSLPVGIESWQNKLFVTIPRWRDGIPSTLNYIPMDVAPSGSPPVAPYPDWAFNKVGDCANGLTTVYRIKADACGRLWVLDTGTIGIGNTTRNICPYAINVFDLATDTRIRRYELRPEDTNANTFIANIAIDMGRDCEDTFAYLSDELGYGLIAYSWEQNKSWRFAHSFFFPDPLRGDFNVAGLNFQWGEEGIFGITVSPLQHDGYRTLYFSPLASHREFAVSTKILRDSSKVEDSYHDFQILEERDDLGHVTSTVMDDEGLMLFNLIDQNSIGCWHSSRPYQKQFHGIVDRDDVALVFPSDVKIDAQRTLWVMSDRMPVFLIAELDFSDVNFRVFSANLDETVRGTVCDVKNQIINVKEPQQDTIFSTVLYGSKPYTTTQLGSNAFTTKPYTTTQLGSTSFIPKTYSSTQLGPNAFSSNPYSTTKLTTKPLISTQYSSNAFNTLPYSTTPYSPSDYSITNVDHLRPKASWWHRQLY